MTHVRSNFSSETSSVTEAKRDSPASRGMQVRSYTFVWDGPIVKSAIPASAVNPLVGDWRTEESEVALGSRREGDEIMHGVVVSASVFWSDCSRIGRRQPSNTSFSSANLIGADDF